MEKELFVLGLSLAGAPAPLPFLPRILFCPCLADSSYGQLAVKDTLDMRRGAVKVYVSRANAVSVDVQLDNIEAYCSVVFVTCGSEESTMLVMSNVDDIQSRVRDLYGDQAICCPILMPTGTTRIRIPLARLCYRCAQYASKGVDRAVRASAITKQLLIETNVR